MKLYCQAGKLAGDFYSQGLDIRYAFVYQDMTRQQRGSAGGWELKAREFTTPKSIAENAKLAKAGLPACCHRIRFKVACRVLIDAAN